MYSGSTSDYLASEGMELHARLERGLLHDKICLFGDNAYVNTKYMATPYLSTDQVPWTYNFFHSQLRLWIYYFALMTYHGNVLIGCSEG